jgi:EmrB/QacA subfamily drug resistance transporter
MPPTLHPACDKAIAQCAAQQDANAPATPNANWVLATCVLASSLAFIDSSVVNVGLPAIGQSLSASGAQLSWAINGYTLPLCALLLIGGALGDVYGRRRWLMLGVALFAMASVLCAVAPSLNWLVAGRVLQGLGAAMLMPNSLAILGATFAGEARGRAVGIWAAAGAAAGAVGPLLGGWLIDTVGWRAIFYINVPLAAAALALAARYVPDDRAAEHPPLDWRGASLAAAGLTALTWGLTSASAESAAGGLQAQAVTALGAGAVLLAVFVWAEKKRGDAAMVPLALFSSAPFVGLSLLTLLLYGALGGLLVLVPYVLIQSSGYSATQAGAALLPLPLVIALTSPWMGQLATHKSGPRLLLSVGPMVVAVGCGLATRIGGPGSYWLTTLPAMGLIAIGMACAVAPLTTAVLASVSAQHTGVASGLNSALARLGGLIATAAMSVVLAAKGAELLALYQTAAWLAALAAVAAGASAWLLLKTASSPDE